jgi:hypothetical protein
MNYKIDKNIFFLNGKKIEFDYPIVEILEFDTSIIIFIAPTRKEDYEQYDQKYSWKNNEGPVWGFSKEGVFLWQWKIGYVNSIKKGEIDEKILLSTDYYKKKPCLMLYCVDWVFYVDPKTGEKLREEQTK